MRMLVILGLVLSMSVTENSFADGGRDGDYYREFGQSIGRYFRNKYGRGHEKRSKETLKGKRVRIDLDGSDYREVKVDAEQVKVRFSGSGELVITPAIPTACMPSKPKAPAGIVHSCWNPWRAKR